VTPDDRVLLLLPPAERYPASRRPDPCPPLGSPVPSMAMLTLPANVYAEMVGHCLGGLPDEACGLLGGDATSGAVARCYPTRNLAASAKLYTVDPAEHLRADRDAESRGIEIMGVFHSHTHTDAYPSPTDVSQAPDPAWHYVIVSLRDTHPTLRSYRILGDVVEEEPVVVEAVTRSP
jgi:[CysO sulfur-carrier protein]-S-L-cysteine hydrolase